MAGQEIMNLSYLPEQAQEDALHAARLLSVEERPFQRVTGRILGKTSTVKSLLTYPPSSSSEGDRDADAEYDTFTAEKFRHDVLVDFANLESSLIRIQLILSSNQRERERYAEEKAKIIETAQAVRDNTVELRAQLLEAQRIMEQRKGYDEHAAKILDDKKLKSRDETRADIAQLEKEIDDLQQESAEYEVTWVSRKEQFDNVVREGDAMIRLIKGIKDDPEPEAEKDDDMEDTEEGDGEESAKADDGRFESPAPEGRSPRPTDASGDAGGSTPRPANKFLEVDDVTRSNSRVSSPLVQPMQVQYDVDMGEAMVTDVSANEAQDSQGADVDQDVTPQVSTPAPDIAMDET